MISVPSCRRGRTLSANPALTTNRGMPQMTELLVTGNRTQRRVLAEFARTWDLNVLEADNIAAAEASLGPDAAHCDLFIVDHALLGASAASAVASLRARPMAAGTPLLVLSARHLRPGEADAIGASGFVIKPIRPARLREALMLALAGPAAHDGDAPAVSSFTRPHPVSRGRHG